ncbi:MAG: hypothetical protein CME06_09945 [Gemmatimonadetes bacterium]|nr:hypothetical protein [Gemmatimonadota bacterium]
MGCQMTSYSCANPKGRRRFGLDLPRLSSTLLTFYVLAGAVLASAGAFYYVHGLMGALREDAQIVSEVYGRFCSIAGDPDGGAEALDVIFDHVIRRIDFPVIITDREGVPRHWVNVGLPPDSDDLSGLRAMVEEMDLEAEPIDVRVGRVGPLISRVHFAESDRISDLRRVPLILGGVILLFGGLGLWIIYLLRKQEHRAVWVGMARETAHQLGTPLSGLAGWVELLGDGTITAAEASKEMAVEIGRLEAVAARFGRIGSRPRLVAVDLRSVVIDVLERFRTRSAAHVISFEEEHGPGTIVRGDGQLLAWVVENVVSNAVDACRATEEAGTISVWCAADISGHWVRLTVRDNGRGMTMNEARRAFRPGQTSKETGWGLGLALARRIVEDDHGGRIFIARSRPGDGTTVELQLPLHTEKADH